MQVLIHRSSQTYVPLGQRRGTSDLARFALDLTWARAETESAAGTTAYPSPPMSGSPPLPPKQNQEAGDRGQGSFQASSHDAYRAGSILQGGDLRAQPGAPPLPAPLPPRSAGRGVRPFQLEAAEQTGYPYRRPEEAMGRPMSYALGQMSSQPHYPLPPVEGPVPGASPYSLPARPQTSESSPYTSPKSQRKTKGHVASACVPCKKAHLRCDAQRPCSRCLSNGKEDACVDVQHKKRGRPRLRDDRETRFENHPRFQHPDPTRRPVSLYAPVSAPAIPFDDPLRRTQSYRILKSQPPDPIAPRYLERGSAGEANIYPPPLSIPTRALEPVAFLTVDLEVTRVSNTFVEAIGAGTAQTIERRKLVELISPNDRERVMGLQRSLQDEQARKEPNYLPPIFGREEANRVIQALPFDPESISRFPLDRQEFLTFISFEGQFRPYSIRTGLAKEDSIYFVVMVLQPRPFPHPTPSPHAREVPYSYQPQPYTQLTPVSASFDPSRQRFGDPRDHREGAFTPRQPPTPAQLMAGLSPGVSPSMPGSSPTSTTRAEHPSGPSYHIPRSELPGQRPPQQPFQLPPIRSQGQPDLRAGRVDIGGLIDKPDTRRGP
ncbi:uncharacterized protein BCR38DRAFT_340911 [Pseudomassariella vexata]|uniref:Zn(2)-C6 fungal-type domain-containing protein n=1 Tax=Pseudomassariella vexata TaxID=1141098 RepID=A0A1Y2E1A6_9PEZI|nr:uncharacterized protein BCR38DRAFT_340911 [Pseudomassariella vexata]ORY65318.1 hypothetical protein BCR38DRAFT_340911 [Pseudomassariella vexata]